MATETALRVSSPRPVARRDCTFREGRWQSNLSGPNERSLHLVPTDVPPDPGSTHGPAHVGGRADPGRRTAQIPAQVGNAQPSSLDAVRARYLAQGADARVVEVLLANRTASTYSKYEGIWNRFVGYCADRGVDPWYWSDLVLH